MRLDLIKKPEGCWASFNEVCDPPIGDGKTFEFKTPVPASEAREILVMCDFMMMATDGRLIVTNEKTGSIERDDKDGYRLETRGENELWVVFDRPRAFGTRVSVSGLGRKVGDAFKILPMSTKLQKDIGEKQPEILRKSAKERERATPLDFQKAGAVSFDFLVVDWVGIEGDDGQIACTPANKQIFLDRMDAAFFGLFVSQRASAIRTERITSFAKDSGD